MVAMEHNNQSSRSRLGEQSPAALFSIVPRLGHPRRHQLPRPLLPRAPDTVGSESQNLLDFRVRLWSNLLSRRSKEAGVAFAFPPTAPPAFGKRVRFRHTSFSGQGLRLPQRGIVPRGLPFCQGQSSDEILVPCQPWGSDHHQEAE